MQLLGSASFRKVHRQHMRNAAGVPEARGQFFKPRRGSRHQDHLRPTRRQRFRQAGPDT
jgi:hypothetical protein